MIKSYFNATTLLCTLLFLGVTAVPSFAQIQWNGSIDFELNQGGKDSRFITNGVPSKYKEAQLAITQFNAFMIAPISQNFFFESRLQLDTWGNGSLNDPRIALASITWDDPNRSVILKAGRFVSPFGFYSKRPLSVDRVFTRLPLAYTYFTNISDIRGYWPQAGNNTNVEYDEGDVGLTTLYFGGYTTGLGGLWEIQQDRWFLDFALTNNTPISKAERSSLGNIAATARLQFNPNIYWNQGFSLSYGNFLQDDPINESGQEQTDFSSFTQFLVGTDYLLSFTYFEIVGEVVYSNWQVPRFNGVAFSETTNGELETYSLSNISTNIDIKYESPRYSGAYLAIRAELLHFLEADDPQSNQKIQWDDNVERVTAVIGYKLTRNLITKLSFSEQTPFDASAYSFRISLNAFF